MEALIELMQYEIIRKRLQEASNINRSLLSLHSCIDQLANGAKYVAYRNSLLTRLLQNALGGSGRASIICNIDPSVDEAEETMSTLRFGSKASTVTNDVVTNVERRSDEEWSMLVREKDLEIRKLKDLVRRLQKTSMPQCNLRPLDHTIRVQDIMVIYNFKYISLQTDNLLRLVDFCNTRPKM